MTIEAARDHEAAFFARHAAYKTLTDRCTTRVLMSRLSALLGAHARGALPGLKKQLHVLWPSARAGVERAGRG